MATTAETRTKESRPVAPPPTEEEVAASGAYEKLAAIDPWEGFTEEDRERGWRELTPEEARFQRDRAVRLILGISLDEFIRRCEAGEYDEYYDKNGYRYLMHLGLTPSGRR